MIDAVRKICNAGEKTTFNLHIPSVSFLVKNFTSGPVIVCLGTWDVGQSVMVAANTAEVVVANSESARLRREATFTVIVSAEQTGTVEVIRND